MNFRWSWCLTISLCFFAQDNSTYIIPKNGSCTPGELVWVDCNLCTCNPQGMPNPVCAKMWCQITPALREAKAQEKKAELEKQMEVKEY